MRPKIQTVQQRMILQRNVQRTTHPTIVGDEGCIERGDGLDKQRGSNSDLVEPQSYRDVLVNGGNMVQMMT